MIKSKMIKMHINNMKINNLINMKEMKKYYVKDNNLMKVLQVKNNVYKYFKILQINKDNLYKIMLMMNGKMILIKLHIIILIYLNYNI